MKTALALAVSLLLSGCWSLRSSETIIDRTIPHRISRPQTLSVWARLPNGTMAETRVRIEAGWWIASPLVIEAAQ